MADEKSLADGISEHTSAGGSHRVHQTTDRRRWSDFLKYRWPTMLAIALAALTCGLKPKEIYRSHILQRKEAINV